MTKNDIVTNIARATGLRQMDVKQVVQLLFNEIIETLVTEGRIELRDFGVLEVKLRKARKALNPRTRETVLVPQRKAVAFKPGKLMAECVAGTTRPGEHPTP